MVVITATYTYEIDLDEEDWNLLTEMQQYNHLEAMVPDTSMIVCETVS
jgi:hypothetical protein